MDEEDLMSKIASLSSAISSHKQFTGNHSQPNDGKNEEERLMQQIARLSEEINRKKRPAPSSTSVPLATSSSGPQFARPCRFFHSYGHCGKGLNCPFSHEAPAPGTELPGTAGPLGWDGGRGRGRGGRGRGFVRGRGRGDRGRGGAPTGTSGEYRLDLRQQTLQSTSSILPPATTNVTKDEDKGKGKTLPVCYRFLLGTCFDEQCPYPHVNVNPQAAVCEAFLAGYCPQGSSCKLLHTYECQAWVRTGECGDPRQCPFKHPANVRGLRRPRLPSSSLPSPPSSTAPSASSSSSEQQPPPSSSSSVTRQRSSSADEHIGAEEEAEESIEDDDDDGKSRFRADDDAEDSDSAGDGDGGGGGGDEDVGSDGRHGKPKRRRVLADELLPDVLSGSIIPKFGAADHSAD